MRKKNYRELLGEFLRTTGMDEDEVLSQVREEREASLDFVREKRNVFLSDMALYSNVKKNKELIGDTTIFNVHDALLSRDYNDRVQVEFEGSVAGADAASKANLVFREDYESDDFAIKKYQRTHDKFFYGVGIMARSGWDGVTKANKWRVVNPMTWIPDIHGDYLSGNYRYTGFDKLVPMHDVKRSGLLNVDSLSNNGSSDGAKEMERKLRSAQGLPSSVDDVRFDDMAEIYLHYAHFNGYKALVRTNASGNVILSAELVRASSPEQKKDPSRIRFPFAFYYWKPKRGDPFGFCVGDFTRDVQVAKASIANMRFDKMKAELYPMYLFNKNYLNSKDITFGFNKAIPVDTGMDGAVPLDNVMTPIRRDLKLDASAYVDASLDKQIERSTSISDIALGSLPEQRDSATANSLAQSNLDLKLVLNSKVNKFGERQMVRLWLEGYWMNFEDGDDKMVSARVSQGAVKRKFSKNDFLSDWNMDFNVLTQDEVSAQKEKRRLALTQAIPMAQDPSKPQVSRDFLNRELLLANGMEPHKVSIAIPRSSEEYRQLMENEILRAGDFVPVNPEDDDDTHLVVLEEAGDNPAVEAHRMAHIMQKTDKSRMAPSESGGMNAMLEQNGAMSAIGGMDSLKQQAMSQVSAQATNSSDALSPAM